MQSIGERLRESEIRTRESCRFKMEGRESELIEMCVCGVTEWETVRLVDKNVYKEWRADRVWV